MFSIYSYDQYWDPKRTRSRDSSPENVLKRNHTYSERGRGRSPSWLEQDGRRNLYQSQGAPQPHNDKVASSSRITSRTSVDNLELADQEHNGTENLLPSDVSYL